MNLLAVWKCEPREGSQRMSTDERLTSEQAAEFIGIKPATLNDWRYRGIANQPKYLKIGNRVWYRKRDLEAWVEAQVVDPERLSA